VVGLCSPLIPCRRVWFGRAVLYLILTYGISPLTRDAPPHGADASRSVSSDSLRIHSARRCMPFAFYPAADAVSSVQQTHWLDWALTPTFCARNLSNFLNYMDYAFHQPPGVF
jgi:hypothetical protein